MTRKNYDWDEIRKTISEEIPKGLNEAMIGMAEDWFSTGETVWSIKEGYINDIDKPIYDSDREIMGLKDPSWATPKIELFYDNEELNKSKTVFVKVEK